MNKFQQDGYLVLNNLFKPEEVKEMKEAGVELTKNIPEHESRVVFNTLKSPQCKDRYFLDSADKIGYFFESGALDEDGKLLVDESVSLNKVGHALHWFNPIFKKYSFCERIKEICFQLGMVEPVIVQSMYIYKNPGIGGEVKEHQDATYLHTIPSNKLIGFWIPLDDATLENGCLWFAPGSHNSGVHRRMIRNPDQNSEELLIYDAPNPTYPASNFIPAPVSKGSCVVINGQVVHKSEHNKSCLSRHAYTFHVVDMDGTIYSPDNWLQPTSHLPFKNLYKN